MHMTTAYDFYPLTVFLLANGADKTVKNGEGKKRNGRMRMDGLVALKSSHFLTAQSLRQK